MNGRGFLGTNASVLADISLILGILVALTLTVGMILAVLKRYQVHRWVQSTAVAINVAQVLTIMVASFLKSAAPGIPQRLGETYYYAALIHAMLGLTTLVFGTFVALRGNELVPQALKFNNYKLFMRTAYSLYILVTALGVWVYITWYINTAQPAVAEGQVQPVAQRSDELTARCRRSGRHDGDLGESGWRAAYRHRRRWQAVQIRPAFEGPELQAHLRSGRRVPILLRATRQRRRARYGRQDQGRSGRPGSGAGGRRAGDRRADTAAHAEPIAGEIFRPAERHCRLPRRTGPQRSDRAESARRGTAGRRGVVRVPDHA
jgi:uncharacterized membrane protein YozB (DUF420 family)